MFTRIGYCIGVQTETVVLDGDASELRRVDLSNVFRTGRLIDLTSHTKIVLAAPSPDSAHSPFSDIIFEAEILRDRQAKRSLSAKGGRDDAQRRREPVREPYGQMSAAQLAALVGNCRLDGA